MTNDEILAKAKELFEGGHCTLVLERQCMKADMEGVSKIIKQYPSISVVKIEPIVPQWVPFKGCWERFYTTDNEQFNAEARAKLEEFWL